MGFYQVICRGAAASQQVINVFWYQTTLVFELLDELLDYEEALAAEFKQTVWDSRSPAFVGGQGWRDVQPQTYSLTSIQVNGYNDDGVINQSDPYELQVGELGLGASQTNGPQDYVRVNANLQPFFGPGLLLPRKGFLKIGPIGDDSVGNDGLLTTSALAAYQSVADKFGEDLVTTDPVGVLEPLRVRSNCIPIPLSDPPRCLVTLIGWRGVVDWVVNPALFRARSRRVEA